MLVDLAACQVRVTEEDYASRRAFEALLARAGRVLDQARSRDARHCLAVFPEMIGAFLPLMHAPKRFRTTDAALRTVAVRNLGKVARAAFRARTVNSKLAFLLAMSDETRAIYEESFAAFARTHDAHVVAGSALLAHDTSVYNASILFAPDGAKLAETRKVNLVPTMEDVLGLRPGAAEDVRAIDTAFGAVATLICYDGFSKGHRRGDPFINMVPRVALRADVLAHPSANPWPWDDVWTFGDQGVPRARRAQWLDEGLASSLARYPIPYAVTAHLVGRVLDNQFDGQSHIFHRGRIIAEARDAHAEDVILRTVNLQQSVETSTASN